MARERQKGRARSSEVLVSELGGSWLRVRAHKPPARKRRGALAALREWSPCSLSTSPGCPHFLGREPPDCAPRLPHRQEVGAEEKAESERFRPETGRQDGVPGDPGLGSVYGAGRAPFPADSSWTSAKGAARCRAYKPRGGAPEEGSHPPSACLALCLSFLE